MCLVMFGTFAAASTNRTGHAGRLRATRLTNSSSLSFGSSRSSSPPANHDGVAFEADLYQLGLLARCSSRSACASFDLSMLITRVYPRCGTDLPPKGGCWMLSSANVG